MTFPLSASLFSVWLFCLVEGGTVLTLIDFSSGCGGFRVVFSTCGVQYHIWKLLTHACHPGIQEAEESRRHEFWACLGFRMRLLFLIVPFSSGPHIHRTSPKGGAQLLVL